MNIHAVSELFTNSQQPEACSYAMWLLLVQPDMKVVDVNQNFICNDIAVLKA